MHVRSVFTSYLARIGWRGRSSARLESWWPHTRTSLGLFPRCSRSAALLQDGRGGQKGREKEQRCLVEFAENVFSWLSAPLRILWTFHPEMFIRLVCCRCILTLGYPLFYPIKKQLVLSSLRGAIRMARALKHQAVVFPPLFSYEVNRKRRRIPI